MIIIPEIETVVILVPRTGSGSLRRALRNRYEHAFMPYRHMEACGVPHGYDRWRKVGVLRDPVARLWSLYKYLKAFDCDPAPGYAEAMRAQVDRPFEDWLLHNDAQFTMPYDPTHGGRIYPLYTVNHPIAENRKSQQLYLRPDLGTMVLRYGDAAALRDVLDVETEHFQNATDLTPPPALSAEAERYVARCFAWDIGMNRSLWARG